VNVFIAEYTEPEGLYRTRFIETRRETAQENADEFWKAYDKLEAALEPLGIDPAMLLETRGTVSPTIAVFEQQSELQREIAEVDGALAGIGSTSPAASAAVASSILGQPIAAGDAQAVLTARKASLEAALETLQTSSPVLAETQLEPDVVALLDEARGQRAVKDSSYIRLANAQVAVDSAESRVETSYTFSGGLAGSLIGRIAVAIAVTIVFGLIAIYTLEWLSQARASSED
jgi:hypothetical protein